MFLLFSQEQPCFVTPNTTEERVEVYQNKLISRDMQNRLDNLLMNIEYGTIDLQFLECHVFFYCSRKVLAMIYKLAEVFKIVPLPKEKPGYDQSFRNHYFKFRLIDAPNPKYAPSPNPLATEIYTFGNKCLSLKDKWYLSMPVQVVDLIKSKMADNKVFRGNKKRQDKESKAKSRSGTVKEEESSLTAESSAHTYTSAGYYGNDIYGLLKFIRNHDSHYQQQTKEIRGLLGERVRPYCDFFVRRFPGLATAVFCQVASSNFPYRTSNQFAEVQTMKFKQLHTYEADHIEGVIEYPT